ncbi:hypothetical protein [Pseudomonas sp. zfem005]|uniref:hypothetical protein n=1 Tax=Pseudomonas sp. zfem005 TaxID=3078200 RepID=UPI00292763E9|nr:hypothetical protein [Pseudomonas sp. zfem005]MDU9415526.1 hypothetical protein [Pseudomonas sp. zfem005]
MSDVKRFLAPTNDTCDMDSYQQVVLAADYDALLASHEQAWKAANSECQDWAREYEKRRAAEAERDQLRAELAAIRGQEVIGRVHHNEEHAEPVRAVLNSIGRELPDNAPLYALPPQQPDAVSVPREWSEAVKEFFDAKQAKEDFERENPGNSTKRWDACLYRIEAAEDVLRSLSTRQAEEGE